MSRLRLRALIGVAALGAAAVLVAVLAVPATQARTSTRVTSHIVTIPCKPANELTARQRATLLATMPGGKGIRQCTPGTSTTVRLTASQTFTGARSAKFTNVQLSDNSCDGRSVYADAIDENGFLGEFVNSIGCGNSAYWAGPIYVSSPYNIDYIQMKLYACGLTCSSVTYSKKHWNPYAPGITGPVNSTYSFCNKTGPGGATIACFYATLD
jgi:hypothetical protein